MSDKAVGNERITMDAAILRSMLHCGNDFANFWVKKALSYLPPEIYARIEGRLAIIGTGGSDGIRIAEALRDGREIILVSERVFPKKRDASHPSVRYFCFLILHEVAHAVCGHRSRMFDGITWDENMVQETLADAWAAQWYNECAEAEGVPQMTTAEITWMRKKNPGFCFHGKERREWLGISSFPKYQKK
jgi:hypothetical protein